MSLSSAAAVPTSSTVASTSASSSKSSWSALVKQSAAPKKVVAKTSETAAVEKNGASVAAKEESKKTAQPTLPPSSLQHTSSLLRTPKVLLRMISLYIGLFSLAPLHRTCKQAEYDLKWMHPKLLVEEGEDESDSSITLHKQKRPPREMYTLPSLASTVIPFPVLMRSGLLRHLTHLWLNCSESNLDAIESGKLHLMVGGGDAFSSPLPSLLSLKIGIHGFVGWVFPPTLHTLEIKVYPRADKIHENYHLSPKMNGGKELYDSFIPLKELAKLSLKWHLELNPKRVDSNGEKETWLKLISALPSLLPLLKCTKLHTLLLDENYSGSTSKGGAKMRVPASTLETLRCHPSLTRLEPLDPSYEWLQSLTGHPHYPYETSIRNLKVLNFRHNFSWVPYFDQKFTHIFQNLSDSLIEIGPMNLSIDDYSFFASLRKVKKVNLTLSDSNALGDAGLVRWLEDCGQGGEEEEEDDGDFEERKESDITPSTSSNSAEGGGITHFSLGCYQMTSPWPSTYIRLLLSLKNLQFLYLHPVYLSVNDVIYTLITGLSHLRECRLMTFKPLETETMMASEKERVMAMERQDKIGMSSGGGGRYCNKSLTSLTLGSSLFFDELQLLLEILPSLRELDVFAPKVYFHTGESHFDCLTYGTMRSTLEKLTIRAAVPNKSEFIRLYALQNLRELILITPAPGSSAEAKARVVTEEEVEEMKGYFRTEKAMMEMRHLRMVEVQKGVVVAS